MEAPTSRQSELETPAASSQSETVTPTTSMQSELEGPSSSQIELKAPTTSSQSEFDRHDDGYIAVESKRRKPKVKRKRNLPKSIPGEGSETDQQQRIQLSSQEVLPTTSTKSKSEASTLDHSDLEVPRTSIHGEFDSHDDRRKAVEPKRRKTKVKRKRNFQKDVSEESGAERDQQLPEQHKQLPSEKGARTRSTQSDSEAPTSDYSDLVETTTSVYGVFDSHDNCHKEVEPKRRKQRVTRKRNLPKDIPEAGVSETNQQLLEHLQLPSQGGAPTPSVQSEFEAHATSRAREAAHGKLLFHFVILVSQLFRHLFLRDYHIRKEQGVEYCTR